VGAHWQATERNPFNLGTVEEIEQYNWDDLFFTGK
jgi:hypothetical protein